MPQVKMNTVMGTSIFFPLLCSQASVAPRTAGKIPQVCTWGMTEVQNACRSVMPRMHSDVHRAGTNGQWGARKSYLCEWNGRDLPCFLWPTGRTHTCKRTGESEDAPELPSYFPTPVPDVKQLPMPLHPSDIRLLRLSPSGLGAFCFRVPRKDHDNNPIQKVK